MHNPLQRLLGRLAFSLPGGYAVRPALQRWRGVNIGKGVWISQQVYLDELYPEAITIGDHCTLGLRCSVFTHLHWGPRRIEGGFKPVIIEPNTFVGPHSVILPGVRIGEGCVIKAGTVVTRDVPPRTFWGAPPAGPLAQVTVPLVPGTSHETFAMGLRPLRGRCPTEGKDPLGSPTARQLKCGPGLGP